MLLQGLLVHGSRCLFTNRFAKWLFLCFVDLVYEANVLRYQDVNLALDREEQYIIIKNIKTFYEVMLRKYLYTQFI